MSSCKGAATGGLSNSANKVPSKSVEINLIVEFINWQSCHRARHKEDHDSSIALEQDREIRYDVK
jgi:hypothetical protein